MARFTSFDDPAVPADPVYWVAAFGVGSSFNDGTGLPVTVTWAFRESGTNRGGQELRPLTEAEKDNIRDAVAKVTADTGLVMVEGAAAEAGLVFAASSDPDEFAYGRTYYPAPGAQVEVLAYDHPYDTADGLARNSYIYKHELLHGVGLGHSTRAFGSTLEVVIPEGEDTGTTLFGRWSGAWTNDIQLFDLAALQYLYGPNPDARAGDDTYVPGLGAFDPARPDENVPLLWDGGGTDTIDLSGADGRIVATLEPGGISRVGNTDAGILEAGTFSINYRSEIENLIGGPDKDRLSGNALDNAIDGGRGRDRISGQDGDDLLQGGKGGDRLKGQGGADTLEGGEGDDRMAGGGGADTFRFHAARSEGDDTIRKFRDGADVIEIDAPETFSHADVTVAPAGSDTVLSWGDTTVTLTGVDAGLITDADILIV